MNVVTELFQVLVTVMLPTDHKDKRQTWVNNDIIDAWTSGYTCMRGWALHGAKTKRGQGDDLVNKVPAVQALGSE